MITVMKLKLIIAFVTLLSGTVTQAQEQCLPDSANLVLKFNNPSLKQSWIHVFFNTTKIALYKDTTDFAYLKVPPGEYNLEFVAPYMKPVTLENVKFETKGRHELQIIFEPMDIVTPEIQFNYDKPVIYLYNPTELDFTLNISGYKKLGFTYPYSENGHWQGRMLPERGIEVNKRIYPYLFWEGSSYEMSSQNLAFNTVNKANWVDYFEKSLYGFGLNSKEISDFITYWLPRMHHENVPAFNICFIAQTEYDKMIPMKISPVPDNIVRVFMVAVPTFTTSNAYNFNFREIKEPIRSGFTVIEWGGTILSEQGE